MLKIVMSDMTYAIRQDAKRCVLPTPNGAVLVEVKGGEWVPIESEHFFEGIEPSALAQLEGVPLADELQIATIF